MGSFQTKHEPRDKSRTKFCKRLLKQDEMQNRGGASSSRLSLLLFGALGLLVWLSNRNAANKLQSTPQAVEVPRVEVPRVDVAPRTDPWTRASLSLNGQCHAKARLGPLTDGGWNTCLQPGILGQQKTSTGQSLPSICGKNDLGCPWSAIRRERWPPKDCIVYSFGSNWDFAFEQAVNALGCIVHTFDPSMPTFMEKGLNKELATLTNINFHPIGLGDKDEEKDTRGWKIMTLKSIMSMLETNKVEILKVDIEDGEWLFFEWLFFESRLLETDTIRQIMVEIHISTVGDTNPETHILTEEEIHRVSRYMSMFEKFGFQLWARDENRTCRRLKLDDIYFHGCLELSFVRTEVKSPAAG